MSFDITTIKLDNDGSIDLTGNQINIISGVDAILQNIKFILKTRKGEIFINTNIGLEHSNLFVKSPDLELLRLDVIEAISQEVNVDTVDTVDITFNRQTRQVEINFQATLVDSEVIESEVII